MRTSPGATAFKSKRPSIPVVDSATVVPDTSRRTVALGTGAPEESRTVPLTGPDWSTTAALAGVATSAGVAILAGIATWPGAATFRRNARTKVSTSALAHVGGHAARQRSNQPANGRDHRPTSREPRV